MDTLEQSAAMTNCPLCRAGDGNFLRNFSGYRLFACELCSGIFCLPFASPPAEFYQSADDSASRQRHAGNLQLPSSHPARSSAYFGSSSGNGRRLLEIGSGEGAFAAFADSLGYQVTALEIDTSSIAVARQTRRASISFRDETLKEFVRSTQVEQAFDVVAAFEVFEHMDDLYDTLTLIKRVLKPDGVIVGSLPNIARLWMFSLYDDYEAPPYHLSYWTAKSWRNYLLQAHAMKVTVTDPAVYPEFLTDRLSSRLPLPSLARKFVWRVVRPLQGRMMKMGASFYFEAKAGSAQSTTTINN